MKARYCPLLTFAVTTLLAAAPWTGCHTTSIKTTWKSPDHKGGLVQKVALLAVVNDGLVRGGFENRFANQLATQGQAALTTYKTLGLQEIKADKEAAAARLRQAGADSILIVRLVDTTTRFTEVRESRQAFVPVTTGSYHDGWHDWYSLAFTDLSVVRGSARQELFLDTSLFDLTTGKRIWSCVTDTLLKEDVDRLEVADAFVARVVAALRKDGLVR
jgi:hypothetical protein